MQLFVHPRRFAYVNQVDWWHRGTLEQQQALQDSLRPVWGTKYQQAMFNFAVRYKRPISQGGKGRSFVTWEIKETGGYLAIAGAVSVALSKNITQLEYMRPVVLHEYGHLWDNNNFITNEDRNWFASFHNGQFNRETWAEAYKDWVLSDGAIWSGLTPILLRTPPPPT